MTFFARPNLSDEQFKQLAGTTLTLSGQTRIESVTGLTLYNNSIGTSYPNVIITAEGADAHVGDVLTYDGLGKICLRPAAGGGDPIYPSTCKSPAAVTLCGICAGFILTGKTLSNILETLLVPTLNPTLASPDNALSISPSTSPVEVGVSVTVTACQTFNRGCIAPYYGSCPPSTCVSCCPRSGLPTAYNYTSFNGASCPPQVSSSLSNSYVLSPYNIVPGNNTMYGSVTHGAGIQPYDSSGNLYCSPYGACTTGSKSATIVGIYPYFYGKIASGGAPAGGNRPTPTTICSCIIAGCNKTVADSTGTISVRFCSDSDDYLWFAIPTASACKTKWYVDALNNASIGGAVSPGGNLFPDPNSVTNITTAYWNNQTYKVYVSNYQTCTKCCGGTCCYIMELRNS